MPRPIPTTLRSRRYRAAPPRAKPHPAVIRGGRRDSPVSPSSAASVGAPNISHLNRAGGQGHTVPPRWYHIPIRSVQTTCCIVGGGPAGMMLGYLLARAGVTVTVLEKHQDFFRDFRGDTCPSLHARSPARARTPRRFLESPASAAHLGRRHSRRLHIPAADFRHLPRIASSSHLCRNGIFSTSFRAVQESSPAFVC